MKSGNCGIQPWRYSSLRSVVVILAGALSVTMATLAPSVASAHEAWIEPYAYHFAKPSLLNAHLRVGKMFRGNTLLYNPDKFKRLDIVSNGQSQPIKGRLGDLPAIRHRLSDNGLNTLVFVSTGERIHYETWEKFENFARKEGVSWLLDAHRQRGLPERAFSETYYRHVKSLIMVGSGSDRDSALGLRHEIVLQENPYTSADTPFSARVLWEGNPQTDVQLTIFRKTPEGETVREIAMTNQDGVATFARHAGHRYLLNSVHALPVEKPVRNGPVWLTHWASVTFEAK